MEMYTAQPEMTINYKNLKASDLIKSKLQYKLNKNTIHI